MPYIMVYFRHVYKIIPQKIAILAMQILKLKQTFIQITIYFILLIL